MENKYGRFITMIAAICLLSGIVIGGLAYYYLYQVPATEPALSNPAPLPVTNSSQEIRSTAAPIITAPNGESIAQNNLTSDTTSEQPISTKHASIKKLSRKKRSITHEKSKQAAPKAPIYEPSIQHTSSPQNHNLDNSKNSRTVTVQNNITKSMLTYSHWTGRYKPTTFAISINGKPLEQEQSHTIPMRNNRITIFYRYSFMNGYRTGARNITFVVDPDVNSLSLTFSWKNKWHVLLDHASPEKAEEVPFEE